MYSFRETQLLAEVTPLIQIKQRKTQYFPIPLQRIEEIYSAINFLKLPNYFLTSRSLVEGEIVLQGIAGLNLQFLLQMLDSPAADSRAGSL